MASLEYRFTQSAPVLRDLARTRRRSPPLPLPTGSSEHSDNVKPFEFIDSSLSLLGDLQRVQDNHLRREFEQQREFIAGKFEQEQYENGRRDTAVDQKFTKIVERFTKIKEQLENFKQEVGQRFEEVGQRFEEVGQRFEEVGQRFEEVGQRFDLVETKLDDFRQEVDQRFSEMNARMFNSLSYRAHHQIYPVAVLRGRRLQKPDENCFPRSIKKFWNLQTRKNAYNRFYLLQFYSIEEYKWWNRESEASESDSSDSSKESLSLEDAARSYPSKCLEALAARLGLDYNKICTEMKRLQEYRQQPAAEPLKRRETDVISSKDGEISKRAHRSPGPSTTSEPQLKQSGNRRSLQGQNNDHKGPPKYIVSRQLNPQVESGEVDEAMEMTLDKKER